MASFAERLARVLEKQGWTQAEAAEKLGVSQALISRYLSGKREPLPRTVSYLVERLGVPVTELAGIATAAEGQKHRAAQAPGASAPVSRVEIDTTIVAVAMKDLKRRWNKKPRERDTIRHLIGLLFPNDADKFLSWLETE